MGSEERTRLECSILDMLEYLNVRSGDKLTEIMQEMHQCLKNSAYDYAMDLDIYDEYGPSF